MSAAERAKVRERWRILVEALAPPAGIPEYRAGYDQLLGSFPIPEGTTIEQADAGGVPAILVSAPHVGGDRIVLWLHSGGFVFGSALGYRFFAAALSAAADGAVLLVDYRLAPEHPFPAALDDARAAYRWLLDQGWPPERLVVAGDSAGGGLALSVLLALKDTASPLPAGAVVVSPMADLTLSGESVRTKADLDPLASEQMLAALCGLYAGAERRDSRYLSPALADLSGLPPLLVLVGSDEVLYDDAVRIVQHARASGGAADLIVGEGQAHVWPLFHQVLSEGQEALDEIGAFVRARTVGR
ncbi:alpha/beta hydrolase [Sporichthya polymorpha]|uniref:alpha/beta hydrolase n=1 Tax=Sporichthya polymorpha TaxID=35751 RepID=UPI000370B1F3|nr:alpha/beta hydrolase [Sporichthya polymorpha]